MTYHLHNTLQYSLIVASLLLMAACNKTPQQQDSRPIEVEILQLTAPDTLSASFSREYVGKIEESSSAALSFTLGGRVTDVTIKQGDHVSKGQLLMSVDDSEAQASLAAAQAQLQQAQDAYNRVKTVYDKGGVSEIKWVEVQTKLSQAQSVADIAQANSDNRRIIAPFNGVVGEVNATVGDHLLPGQTAVRLLNIKALCVTFSVPETEMYQLKIGAPVTIDCRSINQTFNAKIEEKSLVANPLSHTYKVKADIQNNADKSSLLPGMNCKVKVADGSTNGYVIPGHAVQTHQKGLYCWVERDGKAQRVEVESAAFSNNGVVISKGLNNGDRVIVSGYQKLYNGATVVEK